LWIIILCFVYRYGIFGSSENTYETKEEIKEEEKEEKEEESNERKETPNKRKEEELKEENKRETQEKTKPVKVKNLPPSLSLSFGVGFGDNNYRNACKLSEVIISLLNEYMNEWYNKVTIGEENIKRWHPHLMTNDIELSGYIMVRIMNSRLNNLSRGMIEYIAVILSSAIFHGLLRGSNQVMDDIQNLYTIKLPVNCMSVYKMKRIREYGVSTLKQAYDNHIYMVQRNADEKMQLEMDKVRIYNEEMKKLILRVLAEIDWNRVLQDLASNFTGYDLEESESDYCISPRRDSTDYDEDYRRSFL